MAKTDEEIKAFIDSREVLTKNELIIFIYGYSKRDTKRVLGHWDYVLQTKDWQKLQEHKENRIKKQHEKRYSDFQKVYNTDSRMKEIGYKKQKTILKNVYNLSYSLSTLSLYNNLIKQNDRIG